MKQLYIGALYAGGVWGLAKTFKKISNCENKKIIIATVLLMYAIVIGVISVVAYFVIKMAVKDALKEYNNEKINK